MSQTTLTFDASILERVVSPEEPSLAAEAARAMLLFAFPERDHVRMHELSEKARQCESFTALCGLPRIPNRIPNHRLAALGDAHRKVNGARVNFLELVRFFRD